MINVWLEVLESNIFYGSIKKFMDANKSREITKKKKCNKPIMSKEDKMLYNLN